MERIRRVISHDLRTPLGTIANYAAILEFQVDGVLEDVRTFAGRIRASSMRAAGMLEWMAEALAIEVEHDSEPVEIDAGALLQRVIAEQNLVARFPARAPASEKRIVVDVELVSFAWRAFLTVMSDACGNRSFDLDLEVRKGTPQCVLDLWVGPREEGEPAFVETTTFATPSPGAEISNACLGLALAEDLIRGRGGGLGLWGRPGASAGLRLHVPSAW